jgi:hypothetical protein
MPSESSIAIFVAQVGLLLLVGRIMGEAAQRIGQPPVAPDEAIISEVENGYDLIVLGANRRAGDILFFGNTAALYSIVRKRRNCSWPASTGKIA